MPKSVETNEESEPVGIIISQGNRDEPTPAFFAYVWGPAPEGDTEPSRAIAPRAA